MQILLFIINESIFLNKLNEKKHFFIKIYKSTYISSKTNRSHKQFKTMLKSVNKELNTVIVLRKKFFKKQRKVFMTKY